MPKQLQTFKLTVEYDGGNYFGFQKQKNHPTIQEELETACRKLFQKKVRVVGAGRTDSGVHAEGQVVHIRVRSKLPAAKIQGGLNHYLPKDISILNVGEAPASFHAQFSAKSKIYEYRILNSSVRSPLERNRSFQVRERLDVAKMKRAARMICGRHDFRAFEASGGRRRRSVRTIKTCKVEKKGKLILITVESGGFLYKMVRSIAGTLIAIGTGRLALADLKAILGHQNRGLVGPTVPPQGLVLKRVVY